MGAGLRRTLYAGFGLLWVTGCTWLVLHYFYRVESEFGTTPHPWEPRMLTVHGILAMVALFLLGWVARGHVVDNWRPRLRRTSGLWLSSLLGALAITGISLYHLTEGAWHENASLVHEVIGVAVVGPLVWHFFKPRRRAGSAGSAT